MTKLFSTISLLPDSPGSQGQLWRTDRYNFRSLVCF